MNTIIILQSLLLYSTSPRTSSTPFYVFVFKSASDLRIIQNYYCHGGKTLGAIVYKMLRHFRYLRIKRNSESGLKCKKTHKKVVSNYGCTKAPQREQAQRNQQFALEYHYFLCSYHNIFLMTNNASGLHSTSSI